MGLRMDDLHAPTVASGPTSQPTANGTDSKRSLQALIAQKDNLEAELSALGSVLDSVGRMNSLTHIGGIDQHTARREHEHLSHHIRRLPSRRYRCRPNTHDKSTNHTAEE